MKFKQAAALMTALWIGLGTTSIALSQNATGNTTPPATTSAPATNNDGFDWGWLGLLGLLGLAGLRRRPDTVHRTTTSTTR